MTYKPAATPLAPDAPKASPALNTAQPETDRSQIGTTATAPTASHAMAPYTLDQVAAYLTHSYWGLDGGQARSFTLDGSRTITYDASRLTPAARNIAEYALASWASATGITFVDVGVTPTLFTETTDVGATTGSATTIGTNTIVSAGIGAVGDVDLYRVTLTAGQTYSISMTHTAGSQTDSYLRVLNASGTELRFADSQESRRAGEYITFTAPTSGTYFVEASSFNEYLRGGYELSIQPVAQITFNDADSLGAYSMSEMTGTRLLRSLVNIPDTWDAHNLNGYMLQTYIHEIGHALGLGHAGPYDGGATWGTHNAYDNDSWSTTVMSYFNQEDNPLDPAGLAYLATIMPADVIAIQSLYGTGPGHQMGATVWGPGGNHSHAPFQTLLNMWGGRTPADSSIYNGEPLAFMIYDSGGQDTLNVSAFSQDQIIDMNPLARSNIGGLIGNVVIARGTTLEHVTSGAGNDRITGNELANLIAAGAGHDTLYGGAGNDALGGGTGIDVMYGGLGNDIFYIDVIEDQAIELPGQGSSDNIYTILGTYSLMELPNIEFLTGISPTLGHTLIGNNINNIIAGNHRADQIYGGLGNDTLYGLDGNDHLYGDAGIDYMFGGLGDDTFYIDSHLETIVELAGEGTDTVVSSAPAFSLNWFANLEHLTGALNTGQLLVGNAVGNRITGGAGNDVLMGSFGKDTLIGGAGADQFEFNTALGINNVDTIVDFSPADDTIAIDNVIFLALTKTGPLAANQFVTGTAATAATHRIIHDANTGQIFYDRDGTGAAAKVLFATVTPGLALTAADFLVT
ncbi:M10 family metallopeptidase C-terminal domain-containing protein [Xinfangfangia sp. CPCC 101601]|uniref:M10 family metallopeptidase C-terminal domain-containing protein n=1 Tax=Pseudogemmobacter lacusdianii TaxID=3069608 RepID=A0ABU0VZQ2_9RHOB|nr:M10 family metallopeptidase C-terminal domain-containing protein [Xinfangfangia sp. CPCC 101601]MDQ2067250.1 M10 family metallopeptidase C-terminal domain-containing protein [Xinfangfangia sp. CPCC 101601]